MHHLRQSIRNLRQCELRPILRLMNGFPIQNEWYRYLPVTKRELVQGIYLTSLGWQIAPAGEAYPPPGHPETYSFSWKKGRILPEFAVVFLEEGRGAIESDFGEEKLEAGDAFFIPPGVWHRYRPEMEIGWRVRWLCFNGETLHRLRNLRHLPGKVTIVASANTSGQSETFSRLIHAVEDTSPINLLLLAGLTMEVVGELLRHRGDSEAANRSQCDEVVRRALDFIWSNCHRPITVHDVANAATVSRRTLERRFAEMEGGSVLASLRHARIDRAKSQLRDTHLSVKEIAYLCGFLDVRSFIRLFRSVCGDSPGKWRAGLIQR